MTAKAKRLGSVCEINPAFRRQPAIDQVCSFVPMDAVDDWSARVVRKEQRPVREVCKGYTTFEDGDVLIAKITPCMENGKCAIARNLVGGIGFGTTEFHVLRAGPEVSPEWVHFFWRYPQTRLRAERAMTGSAGQKRVPTDYLERVDIPVPSLPEQRRIAARLEEADRLRRTRRYALELSNTFLPAAFLEMFGDEHAFDQSLVEDLAIQGRGAIRTGPFGSQLLHSEFTTEGIAVLGIDNAVSNRFEWAERRYISPDKYELLKRYTVYPRDVLITIMGTCGRCAIVPDDIPLAINTKHLCCITLNQQRCLPIFLHGAFLHHPSVQRQLGRATKGAIMEGLNMEIIRNLRIPVPPLPLQQRFAEVVRGHERLRATQREALRQAEHLFQSLLHEAFAERA